MHVKTRLAPLCLVLGGILAAGGIWSGWMKTTSVASAQAAQAGRPDPIRTELQPIVDELLKLYGQGKIDDVLQRMPVPTGETRDDFDHLRQDLINLPTIAGRYQGFDIVASQTLSSRYHELYVLIYFEKEPFLFEFGFYRVGDAWQVQRFKLRPDLGAFLDSLWLRRQ